MEITAGGTYSSDFGLEQMIKPFQFEFDLKGELLCQLFFFNRFEQILIFFYSLLS